MQLLKFDLTRNKQGSFELILTITEGVVHVQSRRSLICSHLENIECLIRCSHTSQTKYINDYAECGLSVRISCCSNCCDQTPLMNGNFPQSSSNNLLIKNPIVHLLLSFNVLRGGGIERAFGAASLLANLMFQFLRCSS